MIICTIGIGFLMLYPVSCQRQYLLPRKVDEVKGDRKFGGCLSVCRMRDVLTKYAGNCKTEAIQPDI